jgi:N6-adenosine-specific RNA methylase IME4
MVPGARKMSLAHPRSAQMGGNEQLQVAAWSQLLHVAAGERELQLPPGLPFEEWLSLGRDLLLRIESDPWRLGDWWRYGTREYGAAKAQAALSRYSLQTCKNAASVAKKFEDLSRRRDSLSFAHHEAVAGLDVAVADDLLDQAEKENLTSKHLRHVVSRLRNDAAMGRARTKAAPLAKIGKFAIVLADPPWRYEHGDEARAIENHYETMPLEYICELKVPAADDAMLFLCSPACMIANATKVIEAWGFVYRTNMVWEKPSIGPGVYVRSRHELLLIAMRGYVPPPAEADRPDSVIVAPRGTHSEKPDIFYKIIECMYPGLPKVEMFARSRRDGWVAWGDQV